MDKRKEKILKLVIKNYIKTGQPVGSGFLVENGQIPVSGATMRNELRALEEDGFLTHPHTSAGRVPTELGYRYYLDNTFKIKKNQNKIINRLIKIKEGHVNYEEQIKGLAKQTSELVNLAVVVVFGENRLYYTGLSSLFSQQEFRQYQYAVKMSEIFDRFESQLDELDQKVGEGISLFVGKQNPLGNQCGLVAGRIKKEDIFSIIGPMRMDYAKSAGLVQAIQEVIN